VMGAWPHVGLQPRRCTRHGDQDSAMGSRLLGFGLNPLCIHGETVCRRLDAAPSAPIPFGAGQLCRSLLSSSAPQRCKPSSTRAWTPHAPDRTSAIGLSIAGRDVPALYLTGGPRHAGDHVVPLLPLSGVRHALGRRAHRCDATHRRVAMRCQHCSRRRTETVETLPYVGPRAYVVTLCAVRTLRCIVCCRMDMHVPDLPALDRVIRRLARDEPLRSPELEFREGSWQVARWSPNSQPTANWALHRTRDRSRAAGSYRRGHGVREASAAIRLGRLRPPIRIGVDLARRGGIAGPSARIRNSRGARTRTDRWCPARAWSLWSARVPDRWGNAAVARGLADSRWYLISAVLSDAISGRVGASPERMSCVQRPSPGRGSAESALPEVRKLCDRSASHRRSSEKCSVLRLQGLRPCLRRVPSRGRAHLND